MINIEEKLPEFAQLCKEGDKETAIMLTQAAFGTHEQELLGAAIQFAGQNNKIVTIIPQNTV